MILIISFLTTSLITIILSLFLCNLNIIIIQYVIDKFHTILKQEISTRESTNPQETPYVQVSKLFNIMIVNLFLPPHVLE